MGDFDSKNKLLLVTGDLHDSDTHTTGRNDDLPIHVISYLLRAIQ